MVLGMRVKNGAWTLVLALGVACGSTSKEAPKATSTGGAGGSVTAVSGAAAGGSSSGGGGSSSGGASVGGAGTASGISVGGSEVIHLGDTLTEACIAYAYASCHRSLECSQQASSYSCLNATLQCPDVVASLGSTRTVAGLQACAAAYSTFPCADLQAGKLPDCVTPGQRKDGDVCEFPSQCQALTCVVKDSTCGKCATLVNLGETCDGEAVSCVSGLVCDASQIPAKCVEKPESGPLAGPGQPCTGACVSGYYCDGGNSGVCVAYQALGMSCAGGLPCVAGSYCEVDGLTCKAMPSDGQACGVDAFTGQASACSAGLYCNASSKAVGVCQKAPGVGQPCLILLDSNQMPSSYICSDSRCDLSGGTPMCVPLGGAGSDCTQSGTSCASGLNCTCTDGDVSCATRTCYKLRFAEQSCTEPGFLCHPGFSCTAGKCVPKDSQGLFAKNCMR
jgi:hypothetical protein